MVQAQMVSTVEQLRNHNLAQLMGIKTIKIYQNTLSKVTPDRCRYKPSCSQYGLEAISEWGLVEGIKLTRKRISRCHRPNGGYDPVPLKNQSFAAIKKSLGKTTQQQLDNTNFETIKKRDLTDNFIDYDHHFRLILSYPCHREFISMEDFRAKIIELNHYIFEVPDYALLYRISNIEIGAVNDYYLLRFAGSMSSQYLEGSVDGIISYIIEQLAGFLLAARTKEFEPLYFQVDGQVFITPKQEQKAVPVNYQPEKAGDFWDYTSDTGIWDIYWGNFAFDLLSGVSEISGLVPELLESSIDDVPTDVLDVEDTGTEGCNDSGDDLGDGDSDFGVDGDGCDSDGCDGDGCDSDVGGCDLSGCDLGGCDLGGCDVGGCDLGGCA